MDIKKLLDELEAFASEKAAQQSVAAFNHQFEYSEHLGGVVDGIDYAIELIKKHAGEEQ